MVIEIVSFPIDSIVIFQLCKRLDHQDDGRGPHR